MVLSRRSTSYAAVVSAFVMWGTVGLFVRAMDVSSYTFVFADAVVTVAILVPLLFITGHYRELRDLRNLAVCVSIGFLATATGVLYYQGVQMTTVTNAILGHYTMPVFVVVLAPFFLPERRKLVVLIALPVALAGLLTILPLEDLSLGNTDVVGIGFAVASAIFYALSLIGTRWLGGTYSALTIAATMYTANAIGLAVFVLSQPTQVAALAGSVPFFLVKGIVVAALPGLLYAWSLKFINAQRASIIGFLEPLSGIVLAMLFLGEVPGVKTLIGGLLILGAGYWVIARGGEADEAIGREAQLSRQ